MSLEKLGQDEWVASVGTRRRQDNALQALIARGQRLPRPLQIVLLTAIPVLLPVFVHNDYILRVGGLIFLYAVLSLGLNVVVGYVGLLDLGYVAFFGVGGYGYALLSSPQFNIHLPTLISVPLLGLAAAGLGFLLGLPSLRLSGDYLAIVTLGFGQIFVQLMTSMNRVQLPGSDQIINLTGGPNGIPDLDRLHILGLSANSVTAYYYILLVSLALTLILIFRLNQSRLGRAWRAIREDALAAEAMGIPTNRLRLQGFAVGAGIAGVAGAIFAAWQQSVFPANFDVTLLITLYAMVVLGGVGSLYGIVIGAFIITALPELLRPGQQIAGMEISQIAFYGGVIALLAIFTRPRWRLIILVAALIVGGMIVHGLAVAVTPGALLIPDETKSLISNLVQHWLAIPADVNLATNLGNLAFFGVVFLLVLLTRLPKRARLIPLLVTLYLLAFVWETRLSKEPSTTNLLLTGALLVMLMNYRPQGLFGQRRVEIA